MKIKLTQLILILIFLGLTIYNIIAAISGLAKSETCSPDNPENGALCEFEVDYAQKIYWINKKLYGLIPAGTDHYYLVSSKGTPWTMMVKAKDEWFAENFDSSDGKGGKANKRVVVCGEVREFSDSSKNKIAEMNGKLSHIDVRLDTDNYVDPDYRTRYVLKLVTSVMELIGLVAPFIIVIRFDKTSQKAIKLMMLYMLIAVLAAIVLNTYIGKL